MSCKVHLPTFYHIPGKDDLIFDWLDALPRNERGEEAYKLESSCIELTFEREEDAVAFKLKFNI